MGSWVQIRSFLSTCVLLIALLGLALAWRYTSLRMLIEPARVAQAAEWLRTQPLAPLWLAGAFTIASLALVPLTLLVFQCGLLLGAELGIAVSLLGVLISVSLGFLIGRLASDHLVFRLAGARTPRLSQLLAQNALLSVAVLRLFPIAPFTIVNFIGGASKCSYRTFLFGSLLGLSPAIIAISVFGRGVYDLLTN